MESSNKLNKISVLFVILLCVSAFAVLSRFSAFTVFAYENNYLRVINDTTPFYSEPQDATPLFYLPYTYYVKVIDYENDFVHAEIGYGKTSLLDGYVPKDMLFEDNLGVSLSYPEITVNVLHTTPFFLDNSRSKISQYIFSGRQVQYYGYTETDDGEVLYYVSYNNKLGYISQNDVYPFTVANHPNELTFIVKPAQEQIENPPENQITEDNLLSLKWVIIICIGFAGIIGLVYALGKKPYRHDKYSYYNENRTE